MMLPLTLLAAPAAGGQLLSPLGCDPPPEGVLLPPLGVPSPPAGVLLLTADLSAAVHVSAGPASGGTACVAVAHTIALGLPTLCSGLPSRPRSVVAASSAAHRRARAGARAAAAGIRPALAPPGPAPPLRRSLLLIWPLPSYSFSPPSPSRPRPLLPPSLLPPPPLSLLPTCRLLRHWL